MNRSSWIRQIHRWLAITFTVTVVVTFLALVLAEENSVEWVSYVPLFPLFLLMATGLYLFALPYTAKRRTARRTAAGR